MITEEGIVLKAEEHHVWVQTRVTSTCGACQARHGCGQKLLNGFGAPRADVLAVCPEDLSGRIAPGDRVEIAIEEGAVVWASLAAYGIPLAGLIVGIVLGRYLPGAVSQVAMALLGLLFGAALVRWLSPRFLPTSFFEPRVVRHFSGSRASAGEIFHVD